MDQRVIHRCQRRSCRDDGDHDDYGHQIDDSQIHDPRQELHERIVIVEKPVHFTP